MKFLDEFRDKSIAAKIITAIHSIKVPECNIMEVCGTHTVSIFRNGLRDILPKNVNLISGPGCPVCVTSQEDIDYALALTNIENITIMTFGDMMKVPGTYSSLEKEKAKGKDVRIVYSPRDAVIFAKENPSRQVVFIAVGFETTSPLIASCVLEAKGLNINNFSILCCHKIIPPAMKALLDMGEIKLHGFICPGHVSVIIGSDAYNPIVDTYHLPCVISGFEVVDILQSILMILRQIVDGRWAVEVAYIRAVTSHGNRIAQDAMKTVFDVGDVKWRGLGVIPGSGLVLREEFSDFNALEKFHITIDKSYENPSCRCAEVLRGIIIPPKCDLFRKKCKPDTPYGPCMVSSEGTCSAYYKYAG